MNAKDAAIGFEWFQVKKDKLYPKWARVNGFCTKFGISPQVGKDSFIPESLFYLLGIKKTFPLSIQ